MASIYCPYSDREWPLEATTDEHIFPLSLGGNDAFSIRVYGKTNSEVGSRIDGELAKEFVVNSRRARHDARGHSGKEPTIKVRATNARTGAPLSLRWGKGVEVYDPIAGKRIRAATKFNFRFDIDVDMRLRFLAKVFLSGGYHVYQDLFRSFVEHRHPRLLMTCAPRDMSEAEHTSIRMRAMHWWNDDLPGRAADLFRLQNDISSVIDASFVVFKPGRDMLEIFGGVLGAYLGMLAVPADTSRFPRDGDHDVGHAVVIKAGQVRRVSLRVLMDELQPSIEALWLARETSGA